VHFSAIEVWPPPRSAEVDLEVPMKTLTTAFVALLLFGMFVVVGGGRRLRLARLAESSRERV
jgi:hypothetical protein